MMKSTNNDVQLSVCKIYLMFYHFYYSKYNVFMSFAKKYVHSFLYVLKCIFGFLNLRILENII